MFKKVLISLAMFILTFGIGIGAGLGVLMIINTRPDLHPAAIISRIKGETPANEATQTQDLEATDAVFIDEEQLPSVTDSAQEVEAGAKENLKILVLNATGVAGKAGTAASSLEANDYQVVETGNAELEYEAGTFIYQKSTNAAVESDIAAALETTLTPSDAVAEEDADGVYDIVIVLNE